MSKQCNNKFLKTVSYLDIRKDDLNNLTSKYIKLSDKILELENKDLNDNTRSELHDLNIKIYDIQDRLFENNSKNIEYIASQKTEIKKKNKALEINKQIDNTLNTNIKYNTDLEKLRSARVINSLKDNKQLDRSYTIYFIFIVLFIIIQIAIIITHDDSFF